MWEQSRQQQQVGDVLCAVHYWHMLIWFVQGSFLAFCQRSIMQAYNLVQCAMAAASRNAQPRC
jgi:hypothetical protein